MAEIDFYDKAYDRYETIELISTNTAVPDSRIYKLRANNDYCALAIPSDYKTDYIYQDAKNINHTDVGWYNDVFTLYKFSINVDKTDIYRISGDVKMEGEYHGAPNSWWHNTFYIVDNQKIINQMLSVKNSETMMNSMPGYSYINISDSRDGTITAMNQAIICNNCDRPAWFRYDIPLMLEARSDPYTFYVVTWQKVSHEDWTRTNYVTPLKINVGYQFARKDLKRSSVKFMVKNVEYTVLRNSSNVFS